jgi:hypothetical protein
MEKVMKVNFKVHGVSKGFANARTEIDGETITASVPCLEVELTTVAERSGSLTLRFVGSSMEQAAELFKQDALLSADFVGEKDYSAEKKA